MQPQPDDTRRTPDGPDLRTELAEQLRGILEQIEAVESAQVPPAPGIPTPRPGDSRPHPPAGPAGKAAQEQQSVHGVVHGVRRQLRGIQGLLHGVSGRIETAVHGNDGDEPPTPVVPADLIDELRCVLERLKEAEAAAADAEGHSR